VALLPRRSAIIAAFAATMIVAAVLPAASAVAGSVPAPVLTGPADNTSTPLKSVVMTWDTVPGAVDYQVQVSPNAEWTNNTVTLPNGGVTPNALYEMPISLPHAAYYWRVRAEVGATWGPYSAPRQFLRDWEDPMTILKAPTTADPTISWEPVPDASEYLVRFSTSANFLDKGFPSDNSPTTFNCWTNQTSFTPYALESADPERASNTCINETMLTNGTPYYWEVEPLDDSTAAQLQADTANDPGEDCYAAQPECDADQYISPTTFTFEAPTHSAISASSVTGLSTSWHTSTSSSCDSSDPCPMTPTFSWTPVTGANFYQVTVYRDPALSNVYRQYDTAWPELTPRDSYFDAQAGHAYYWTVFAGTCDNGNGTCDAAGAPSAVVSVPSAVQTFDKTSGAVDLSAPANGATEHGRSVTFSWSDFQASGGQGGYDARNYELQVSKTKDFASPLIDDQDIDLTQFTDPNGGLADGTYYWRVAPIDESGNLLTWSKTRHLTVNADGPTVSITSANGISVKGPITIHLSEAVDGVSKKTVKVVPADGGGSVAGKLVLGSDSKTYEFTPKHPLVTGERYNLSVSPTLVDSNGNSAVVTGNGVRTTKVAKDNSKGWNYSHGWSRHKASGARSGSYESAKSGATASLQVAGGKATLYGCDGPDMGKLKVKVGGHTTTVTEHQSFTRCGVEVWHGALPAGASTLKIKVTKKTGNIDEVKVK
jgi:hypothetical protein